MSDSSFHDAPDIPGRFIAVACSLRELADRLEKFDLSGDSSHLMHVSSELMQIGWNTLFVGSAVDSLILSPFGHSGLYVRNPSDLLRQVDSLQVAVTYLARSIRFLKGHTTEPIGLQTEIDKAYQRLGEKLQEVACECQHA